jgi:hypothetical protein
MKSTTHQGTDGHNVITLPSGFLIRQEEIPDVDQTAIAALHFRHAAQEVADFQQAQTAVVRDAHLSATGQNARLEPLAMQVVAEVARYWTGIDNEEKHFNLRLQKLYAVPAAADVLQNARDAEMRAWWATQSMDACAKLIDRMSRGPELAGLELALLRGPLANIDSLMDATRSSWQTGARVNNPAEFGEISAGLHVVTWARRGMLQLGVALLASLDRSLIAPKLLQRVMVNDARDAVRNGFGVFGHTATDVAEVLRQHPAGHSNR